MIKFAHIPLKDFIKKYNPQEPKKETIENFEKGINSLLENAKGQDGEEFQKNEINSFLKNTYDYHCNTYEKVDSAIYVDGKAWVLIEVKALNNRNEFPKDRENPLSKAFCQMVFYFLKEIENNNSLKHTIICNAHEFFLFDCKDLLFLKEDKRITDFHKNCALKEGTDPKTKRFYSDLEEYLKKDFKGELRYTYFNLSSDDPKELIYQVLSHEVLLKQKKTLDANTLNKDFYEELLYILGLEEQNEKGKILIKQSRTKNSLSDALKKEYNNLDDEEVMALLIAWNNRILFLRLLESLLISFDHFKEPFLTIENFENFNALNTLFFEVLAKKNNERSLEKENKILGKIPYLNSSLFDKTPLESNGHEIRLLKNKPLEIYSKSILKKDKDYQEKEDFSLLEYLFTFLHAYDFTTTPKDIKDNKNTSESRLINPSVLGLVFEKLNGYKEGSFYTPSFITSYMCSESIKTIVLDKFNQKYKIECEDLKELKNYLKNSYKEDKRKEYLQVLLTLRICDPAVGSGHFLVSALNEMVQIAYELGLITSLYRHSLRLENDEIIIHTPTGEIFNYKKPHSENDPHHQIQKELFELKKSIIENCLFGVDINPNSCEITKLRLWIELLKYSYYIFEEGKNTNNLETLPNIDINIKCGNSLISRFSLHDDLKKIPNIKAKIQEYKDLVAQYKDPNPLFPLNKTDLINKIQDLKNTFSLTLKDPKTKAELEKAIEKHIKNYNDFALDDKSLLDGLNSFIPNLFGTPKLSPKEEEEAFASYGRIRALRKKLDDALSGGEYQNAFEWRFEFPEVLDDEGDFLGFDCIIGNPPYIDYRKIDEKTKIFLSKFSSVYKKSKEGSIFVYFIECASQLIIKHAHGEISFINPIAYLCKPTDQGIRDYIDKNLKITMLIDLSNIKIFESASTYTCINIFKRENKKNEILFQRFDDFTELSSNKDDFLKIPSVNVEHISIFLDPISRHIAERCKTQLGDFCKIFCGLSKTGFRSDVINTNNKKSVYFLESSDIYRYYVNDFGKKFLKRIDDYFSQEKQQIFESQDIIFMTRMTNQIRCVVVPLGVYGGKVNILSDFRIDRFLILGILNSKLMTYFYKKKFFPTHMQGGAFGFDTLSVETLPIPQITKSNKPTADKIIALVDKILEAKEKDPKANTQKLEKEIDALVYQLYNLTDEEIKIIEEGQEIKSD
ncbi:Eco57I restriction-modification methylase domain-containing protein [Helicobacter pylori]|uniref:type IIG restriction enzyme/methyltransferase n=1 Tax=Helicobacter pylori TaxID=210 RepID=UPI001E33DB1B|nr:DNA methyltransferase [Helicobacter pylori]